MRSSKDRGALRSHARVFKALGHEDRLRIVAELRGGRRCVCDLVETVGSSWSTVSRHLSTLKHAGIVVDQKRGLQVFYQLALPCVRRFVDCLDRVRAVRTANPRNRERGR